MAEPENAGNRSSGNIVEFTVSELAGAIKRTLEDGFGLVRLKGEISGYRGPHSSGHCYFALKDDKAKVEAVIWRQNFLRLRFKPEEGMEVIAQGRVTTYPGSSKYQIVIETLRPAGVGALMALLEERKRKLSAEGLFEDARKKQLPFWPDVVGIITSPTGAVIRDMLAGFKERCPTAVLLWPVRVQGETSAPEVAAAIRGFDAIAPGGKVPRPDLLIVARGGGALEDLWGFNEEIVVRAAAECRIPIISAVGHETDWTLIDLVADARAPTPTKAAEWSVPKHSDLALKTAELEHRLRARVSRRLGEARAVWRAAIRGLPSRDALLALPRQRLDATEKRLVRGLLASSQAHANRLARLGPRLQPRLLSQLIEHRTQRYHQLGARAADSFLRFTTVKRMAVERLSGSLRPRGMFQRIARAGEATANLIARIQLAVGVVIENRRQLLQAQSQLLVSLSHQSILQRGFAIVRSPSGQTIRTSKLLTPGTRFALELSDGSVMSTVDADKDASYGSGPTTTAKGKLQSEQAPVPSRLSRSRRGPGEQGSLF